jgi:hypothetical protein
VKVKKIVKVHRLNVNYYQSNDSRAEGIGLNFLARNFKSQFSGRMLLQK